MKKIYLSLFAVVFALGANAQATDFTVTDSEGNTLNLFSTLSSGKTVMLDFFYTTCQPCISRTDDIEHLYQQFGGGTGDFEIWGINDRNSDSQVNAYKSQYEVTNPCVSGNDGGGLAVLNTYSSNYNFTGFPTYSVICSDQSVTWDVWPISTNAPEVANVVENTCGVTPGFASIEDLEKIEVGSIYPNPANDFATIQYILTDRAKISLEVYNILGGLVKTVSPGALNAGEKTTQLNVKDLKDGNYFVKVLINNEVAQVMKLNVLK